MSWQWKVGRIAGIEIRIHATFLILVVWAALSAYSGVGTLAGAAWGVLLILMVFAVVILHELAHALTARRFGIQTRDITLLPIGGVARLERMPEKPLQELAVALAGPAVNLILAAILFGLTLPPVAADGPHPLRDGLVAALFWINLSLAVFNLLPAFPMDGGRALRALLATRIDRVRATEIAATLGKALAAVFAALGLFFNPFLLLIALFVWVGATQEAAAVRLLASLSGILAAQAMRPAPALSPDDPLQRAAERLGEVARDFPVVDEGRLVGVIARRRLLETLALRGPDTVVREIMQPAKVTAAPDDPLADIFRRMQEQDCGTVPVVHDGRLVGLITLESLTDYLALQTALRRHAHA